MIWLASLLVAFSLLTSVGTAFAVCAWPLTRAYIAQFEDGGVERLVR